MRIFVCRSGCFVCHKCPTHRTRASSTSSTCMDRQTQTQRHDYLACCTVFCTLLGSHWHHIFPSRLLYPHPLPVSSLSYVTAPPSLSHYRVLFHKKQQTSYRTSLSPTRFPLYTVIMPHSEHAQDDKHKHSKGSRTPSSHSDKEGKPPHKGSRSGSQEAKGHDQHGQHGHEHGQHGHEHAQHAHMLHGAPGADANPPSGMGGASVPL